MSLSGGAAHQHVAGDRANRKFRHATQDCVGQACAAVRPDRQQVRTALCCCSMNGAARIAAMKNTLTGDVEIAEAPGTRRPGS